VLARTDSIVALSTPLGRSGIGVIRVSGPDSLPLLRRLTNAPSFDPEPNHLTLKKILHPASGEILDQTLVCYFKAPHSFTGEDVVEFHCHGSPVVLRSIIDVILALNARLADPGEFSLRAVANGRMKLAEAEAIRDLIAAQTEEAMRQAARQLEGEISRRLQPAKDALLRLIVRLESSLEFVEDDLPPAEQNELLLSFAKLGKDLAQLTNTFHQGRLLHDGLTVAIVGRPNVGKSSIFNSLLGHNRAIVTDIPGTTRDTISEPLDISGVPVVLVDTAGIRSSTDQIEAIGIDRTRQKAADADLVLGVIDGSEPLSEEDEMLLADFETKRHIIAINKCDLTNFRANGLLDRQTRVDSCVDSIVVSAKTGAGLNDLRAAILKPFQNGGASAEGLLITNARHYDLLTRALYEIGSSEQLARQARSEELTLIGLHNALRLLGEITGETTTEEMLGQIFSTFCIGK
jgi:tRNA modification GTPase